MIHNGEEHCAGCRVRDEFRDKGRHQTHRRHHHYRIRSAYIQNTGCQTLGDTGFLNCKTQYHRSGKNYQYAPVNGFDGLVGCAAASLLSLLPEEFTAADLIKLRARKGQSVKNNAICMVLNRWKTNRKIEKINDSTWRKL